MTERKEFCETCQRWLEAEKAVLEGALRSLETVTRSYLRYPLEGEEPGWSAKDVLAYCDEARIVLADTPKNL